MCNLYTQTRSIDEIASLFRDLAMPLLFPEGVPNLPPGDIRITDPAPIVRASLNTPDSFELVIRRWSWPGPGGKPVYNFRSDGRAFPSGRCLIVTDGFYEFTTPADPKQKRKDRWLFTDPGGSSLGIAGLVRDTPGVGQAFTMLTTEPGADVAAFHSRQVAVIHQGNWRAWLNHSGSADDFIGPLSPATLSIRQTNQ